MAILNLPTSERTAVFRAMVRILKNDPMLSQVIKTWLAWEGNASDGNPLTLGMAPAIRLTPIGGGDEWSSPATHLGPLYINMEILVAGYDADDLMNLWKAVGAAFYDPQRTTFAAIQETLRNAGAFAPSPTFTAPAFDASPDSNMMKCVSQIMIKVQTHLGVRGINVP